MHLATHRQPLTPEDSAASKLTFDNWFTTRLPADLEAEFRRLDDAIEAAKPPPDLPEVDAVLIDPVLGDVEGGGLCWVCFARGTHVGHRTPRFRACYHCLAYDRWQAGKLGLKMLLPLMDWHAQPVLPGANVPGDPVFRGWLADAWSRLSTLEQWRIDGVRSGIALLGLGDRITADAWVHAMRGGPARSRACWDAYLAGYHQRLHDVLIRIDRTTHDQ